MTNHANEMVKPQHRSTEKLLIVKTATPVATRPSTASANKTKSEPGESDSATPID